MNQKTHPIFYRNYFITIVLTDKKTEEEGLKIIESIFHKNEFIHLIEIKKANLKKLNYPIDKNEYANYYTMIIRIEENSLLNTRLNEAQRLIREKEEIIRHLLVRTVDSETSVLQDTLPYIKPLFDKAVEAAKANK